MTSRFRSIFSRKKAIRSSPSRCAISPAPGPRATRAWSSRSRPAAPATCRCLSPACRFFRAPITRRSRSRNRRSTFRSAPALTGSAASSRDATSNTSASRTGGAPSFRCRAATTISTSCASSIIATAMSASRALPPGIICSARNSRRAPGRRATIFRPFKDGRVKKDIIARRHAVRRAGLVHQYAAAEIRRSAACARRCATRSISNGPTRRSCTAPTSAPSRCFRTPT